MNAASDVTRKFDDYPGIEFYQATEAQLYLSGHSVIAKPGTDDVTLWVGLEFPDTGVTLVHTISIGKEESIRWCRTYYVDGFCITWVK